MTAAIIQTLNPLTDPRWDNLIARHPKASVFHQRGWIEALVRTYGYEPVVFTTSAPGLELKDGLLFCRVKSWLTGHRLVSLPFSDHCEPICDSPTELNALISAVQATLHPERCRYLELRPTSEDSSQACCDQGFRSTGRYFLHLLDLRSDLESILHGLDKNSVQRRIGHAERSGIVEKCGRSEALLRDFYGLFVITRGRHHLPPPPYAWLQNLVLTEGEALEIRVAYKDHNPIAAIITLQFRGVAYFKYGCSDARFNKFGATPLLLWRAIAAAKSNGAVQFDLGRTEEENAGLLAFKNHWVPGYKRLTYWRYPGASSLDTAGGWKLKTVKAIFSLMPQRMLVASGKILYRHIA